MTFVNLGTELFDAPDYWANFVREIRKSGRYVSADVIDSELSRFNAHYISATSQNFTRYVQFDSEKDLSFFILRWS